MSNTRTPLLAANWKMHKGPEATIAFLDSLLPRIGVGRAEVVICPPWPSLATAVGACADSGVEVAAQNMHFEDSGAFTGEVSAPMLVELGVDGVVLGHSERRQLFGENDEDLARKVPKALEAGLLPILCVGESQDQRRSGETEGVLSGQVLTDLAEVHDRDLEKVVIAYEPVWAIGTGLTASPEQAGEAAAFIRSLLASRDPEAAESVRILYGGSVKPDNASELLSLPDVDGALVGGASLDADDFLAIIDAAT